MAVTLAQAKLTSQDKLYQAVIDEFRKSSFLLDHMIFDDCVSPTGSVTGLTDLYAARIALDGFHGVSLAGGMPIHQWLPKFDEAGAVKIYKRLNAMLRGDLPEDSYLRGYADTISGALKKRPLQEDIICFRNIDVDPFEGAEAGTIVSGRQFLAHQ